MSGKNSRDFRFKWDFTFLWILPLGNPSDLRWKRILSWVWQQGGKEESLGNKARVFSITKAYSPGRLCQSQVLPKEGKGHVAQSIPLYPSCLNSGLPSSGAAVKNLPAKAGGSGDVGSVPGSGRYLERMATHSSILAWRIPWTEEPGRLQSRGRKESDMTEQAHASHLKGEKL